MSQGDVTSSSITRGVLFDLDGVLLDTEGDYTLFWSDMDRRFPTGVEQFAQVIKGYNLQQILGRYFPDSQVQQHVRELLDEHQATLRYRFFDGVQQLLQGLRHAHVPMALVTSSDDKKMETVYVQHPWFKQCFDAIVTGDMVTRTKPDPECFLTGARLLGVPVTSCWVLEDSLNGLRAARASGARVLGVATTNGREVLSPLCDRVIDNMAQLSAEHLLRLD